MRRIYHQSQFLISISLNEVKDLKLFVEEQNDQLSKRLLDEMLSGNAVSVANPNWPKRFLEMIIDVIDPTVVITEGKEGKRKAKLEVPQDSSLVATTSGTSGTPKAICHSWENLEASAKASLAYLNAEVGDGFWINALPINHVGGFTTITKSFFAKHSLTTLSSFDPVAFEEAARKSDVPVYTSLVKANLPRLDLSLFRRILLGAGTPPSKRPANAVVTYGLTETGSGCVYDGVALESVEVRIEEGEVLLRGPMIAMSYRNGAPLTDDEGYFHTGDRGSIGPDGLLRVEGRISETINTGGEKIAPNVIEEAINEALELPEYTIFGCRDDQYGEIVAVAITKRDGFDISLGEIQEVVSDRLPRFAIPRRLFHVDLLPKTDLGKIQRKRLTEMYSNYNGA